MCTLALQLVGSFSVACGSLVAIDYSNSPFTACARRGKWERTSVFLIHRVQAGVLPGVLFHQSFPVGRPCRRMIQGVCAGIVLEIFGAKVIDESVQLSNKESPDMAKRPTTDGGILSWISLGAWW